LKRRLTYIRERVNSSRRRESDLGKRNLIWIKGWNLEKKERKRASSREKLGGNARGKKVSGLLKTENKSGKRRGGD